MIKDHTIDQCLIELARTMAALKALRAARKAEPVCRQVTCESCYALRPLVEGELTKCPKCGSMCAARYYDRPESSRQHAAALRASLDLTRKLADLRQGR